MQVCRQNGTLWARELLAQVEWARHHDWLMIFEWYFSSFCCGSRDQKVCDDDTNKINLMTCASHLLGAGYWNSPWPYRSLPPQADSLVILPQRLKGAFVPDVCVSWTRDTKVEVSWCLWSNSRLRSVFGLHTLQNESNLQHPREVRVKFLPHFGDKAFSSLCQWIRFSSFSIATDLN